jgi:hypothetical protein
VLIHPIGEDWPEALLEIAFEHPRLLLFAAHTGYGDAPHATHDAADRLAAAQNIVLEFCSTYLAPARSAAASMLRASTASSMEVIFR